MTTPISAGGMVAAESAARVASRSLLAAPLIQPHETPVLAGLRVTPAPPAAPPLSTPHSAAPSPPTVARLKKAEADAALCRRFDQLRAAGLGISHAARILGKGPAWFSSNGPYRRWKTHGLKALLQAAPAAPQRVSGLSSAILKLKWFIPAARFFNLAINRTQNAGSVPEAVRRTISLPAVPVGWSHAKLAQFLRYCACAEIPACPPELREAILARQNAGMPLVPQSISRQITLSSALVRFTRNPTNETLRSMNAAGCSRFARINGEYVPLRAGQRLQPDDGSINFCVTVPWKFPTDATSRRWGVLVGRFQLLLMVDAMSLAIRARSFVVRPRSSYRQEDALGLYNIFMREHGIPEEIWHEGHVWNAGRVKDCLDLLGVRRHLVHSPHNKAAVENRFNKLWTVLSGLTAGQIGRFRGEMARETNLLISCQNGATDPRTVFPPISLALDAIDQAIREANATPVRTNVGSWIPDELWAEHTAATPLRRAEPDTAWMFAPYCLERRINNGVNAKVRMFDSFSVPFCFASDWMPNYHGARAKCYFDPYGDRFGTIVLAEPWYGQRPGTVLGLAKQTNDIGEYARLMLGVGFGPDDSGRLIRQHQAAALRSDRRAIAGSGREARVVTERDGLSHSATLTFDSANAAATEPHARVTRTDFLAAPAPVSRRAADDPSLADFVD